MGKTVRVRINSTDRTTSSGNIRTQTTVSNGHSTKSTTKTIRVKQSYSALEAAFQGGLCSS